MIDWFVVLAPLALLPIVLLFVFVGCPHDFDALLQVPVVLRYDPGSETNVDSIAVTFTFSTTIIVEDKSTTFLVDTVTRTLFNQAIVPPGGAIIDSTGDDIQVLMDHLTLGGEGEVGCSCVITMTSPLPPQTVVAYPPIPKGEDEPLPGRFQLSRDGGSFILSLVKQE